MAGMNSTYRCRHRDPPADGHALSKNLLDSASGVQVSQAGVGVCDQAQPEGAQAQLSHGAVVQDLGADVHVLDIVLHTSSRLSGSAED